MIGKSPDIFQYIWQFTGAMSCAEAHIWHHHENFH